LVNLPAFGSPLLCGVPMLARYFPAARSTNPFLTFFTSYSVSSVPFPLSFVPRFRQRRRALVFLFLTSLQFSISFALLGGSRVFLPDQIQPFSSYVSPSPFESFFLLFIPVSSPFPFSSSRCNDIVCDFVKLLTLAFL